MAEGKPIPGPGPEDGVGGEPPKVDPEKGKKKEYKIGDVYFLWDDEFKEYRKGRIGIINEKTGDVKFFPESGPDIFVVKESDMENLPKSNPGKPPVSGEPIPNKRREGEPDPDEPEKEGESEPAGESKPDEPAPEDDELKPEDESKPDDKEKPDTEPTPDESKPDESKPDEPTPDESKPDEEEPEPGKPEDKEREGGPKFKVGDKVVFLDGDEEEEAWVVEAYDPDEDHPYGKPYRIKRESDGRVEDVTEDDLKEFVEKAEIDKAEGSLTEAEQKFQEEFEKVPEKKKGIARKLTEYYRKNTLLRIAVGSASTLMAGAGSTQVAGVGHVLRLVIGGIGGAMAGEGAATASQNMVMRKLREFRSEGKLDSSKLESLSDEVLEDAYATLTEIASAKGLQISSKLYAAEQEAFEGLEAKKKAEKDEKEPDKRSIKYKLLNSIGTLKERYSKLSSRQQTAVKVGGILVGFVGAGLLYNAAIAVGTTALAAKGTGLAFSGGMQLAMGMVSTQRQIHAEAFERSDDVEALRHELARRGVTVDRFKNISEKAAKNKKGRKKWAIGGAILGGTIAQLLFARGAHAREAAEARAAGAAPDTTGADTTPSPDASAEPITPVTPGAEPTTDGATGSTGTPPVTPGAEPTTPGGMGGVVPPSDGSTSPAVDMAPDGIRPYAVLPGQEAPAGDRPYAVLPGQEAPSHPLEVTEVTPDTKGSDNFLDEVAYADGKENFGNALLKKGGLEDFYKNDVIPSLIEKNHNIPPGMADQVLKESLAKLELEGIKAPNGAITEAAVNKFIETHDPLRFTNNILADINQGISHVEILEKIHAAAGDGALIDTEAATTNVPTGAEALLSESDRQLAEIMAQDGKGSLFIEKMLESEAPGMSEAQLDILADKIASRLEEDGILNGSGGVIDYTKFNAIDPHQIIAEVSHDHASSTIAETASNVPGNETIASEPPRGSTFFSQPEMTTNAPMTHAETLGIVDALTDPNKFSFEAAKPITPDQLKEILNPNNGYLSKEVGETFQRLLDDEKSGLKPGLKPEDFRLADKQIKIDLSRLPEASAPGHADYIGHQLLKDYNGVTEEQKGFFDRIFSGFRKPEVAPVSNAIPEPQPSGNIVAPTPADGTIESGGYVDTQADTPVAPTAPMPPVQTPDVTTPTTPEDGTIVSGGEK